MSFFARKARAGKAPAFWWRRADWRVLALYPVSLVYGAVARRRMVRARREQVAVPVLCVGNFTVGGTGKTPVAMALAAQAAGMGRKPGFLSRGHGGNFSQPRIVDLSRDGADDVGDEPLLLARCAPVAVSLDRAEGARLLIERGCDFLIMDDGFQSAHIHMDYALVVVDGPRGVGNGHVFPGGPLRAPLPAQLGFADALLTMGQADGAGAVVAMALAAGKPVFAGLVQPRDSGALAGRRFLAFAGIGQPERFFDGLRGAGGEIVTALAFPDHHFFSAKDMAELESLARDKGLELATTAKDAARLSRGDRASQAFLQRLTVVDIDVVFSGGDIAERIIAATVAAWRRRTCEAAVSI